MQVGHRGYESQFHRQKVEELGLSLGETESGFELVGLRPGHSERRARTVAAGKTCGSHCQRAVQEEEGSWLVKPAEIGQEEEGNTASSAGQERKMVEEDKIAGLRNINDCASAYCGSSGLVSYVVGRSVLPRELEIGSASFPRNHRVTRLTRKVAAGLGRSTLTVAGRRGRHDDRLSLRSLSPTQADVLKKEIEGATTDHIGSKAT